MNHFKGRHFKYDIIIWAIRWYCKYGISYRELEEILGERGVAVDHSTIYRWVQYYAPIMQEQLKWYWKPRMGHSWRVDETYIKVKGQWKYLYRAIDKTGKTIDFASFIDGYWPKFDLVVTVRFKCYYVLWQRYFFNILFR